MKIAVGADHAGFQQKQALAEHLRAQGHAVTDLGTNGEASVDYPDYAQAVGQAVAKGEVDRGVLVCGTGIGMCITANKVPGVRAAVVWSEESALLAAEHNNANVLCLSGRLFSQEAAREMLDTWLSTPFGGGRHQRRIDKISKLDGSC